MFDDPVARPRRAAIATWRMLQGLALAAALTVLALPAASHAADDAESCHKAKGEQALKACDRAIASGKHTGRDLAKLHTSRGVERKRIGDLDGAIADYSAAIALDPKDVFAYNNRGNSWRDKGNLSRAIEDYSAALRIDPGYTAAYVNRGLVYEKMKNLDAARADYREAIKRPPKYGNGPGGQQIARKRLVALGG
jgi:tetratricopeptide (TPR) repeat protein